MKKILVLLISLFIGAGICCAGPVDIDYNDGIYHIVLKGDKVKKKVRVYASPNLVTNEEVHKQSGALLTINDGYFDPQNSKTVSYVTMGSQTVEDPMFNENLYSNALLRKNLSKILNRTEFRVVECDNKYKYEIVPHKSPVDFACTVMEAVQGGPLILPKLQLEEEFFVVKNGDKVVRESSSVLHKVARTILGIKDGDLHILIITDEHPMDMYEVQALCKQLGFERATVWDIIAKYIAQ